LTSKHKKRHEKPWGCTAKDCHKQFGSKNDWKRHENNQHFQSEVWRCAEFCPSSAIKQCAQNFDTEDKFKIHLQSQHQIATGAISTKAQDCRIGSNGQGAFWCGFCLKIIKLKEIGLQAWEERFNHIDNEHIRNRQTIEEWVDLDKHITKSRANSANRKRRSREDDRCGDGSDDEEGDSPERTSPPDSTVQATLACSAKDYASPGDLQAPRDSGIPCPVMKEPSKKSRKPCKWVKCVSVDAEPFPGSCCTDLCYRPTVVMAQFRAI
jgi:hypothetical protein